MCGDSWNLAERNLDIVWSQILQTTSHFLET